MTNGVERFGLGIPGSDRSTSAWMETLLGACIRQAGAGDHDLRNERRERRT